MIVHLILCQLLHLGTFLVTFSSHSKQTPKKVFLNCARIVTLDVALNQTPELIWTMNTKTQVCENLGASAYSPEQVVGHLKLSEDGGKMANSA